jgi:competence ComEA-like helix-hairpin-helix protein
VVRQGRREEGGKLIFGISDEESRLNVNRASAEELARLYGITSDVVASILDWRDGDNAATAGGAEADYYTSLQPPCLPRNGPFQTTRELLMVRGVTAEQFMGEDANQNGLLDLEEDDGNDSYPRDNRDGILDADWSGMLTVDSLGRNQNAAGEDRVDVQEADEKMLTSVRGISPEIAKAIIAYRGQSKIENLADLLEVATPSPQSQSTPQPNRPANQPTPGRSRSVQSALPTTTRTSSQPTGPKLISEDLLMEIADDVTTSSDAEQAGAISINTASADVLACLSGVSQELAQAIVAYRKSAGFFPNIAWLLKVDGMNREIFKQIAPKVTACSETFRILSEGRVNSTGARKRIEMIVRFGSFNFDTLSYREDL